MKNRKGVLLMLIGILLILAALGLVVYNTWESNNAGSASEDALVALESMRFDRQQGESEPVETPEIIVAPTAEPIPTPTQLPMEVVCNTVGIVTATPAPVDDAVTATPVPTATPAPVDDTATATPVPTATPAPVDDTVTATPMPADNAATAMPVPTATVTPVPTATPTPVPTATPAPTEAPTASPTPNVTPVVTATPEAVVTPAPLPIWERVPDYAMPVVEVGGSEYVGTLTIPALGLKLPVQQTWDYTRLKTSPCVFSGTCYKNGFVVIAHRYNTHFSGLKELRPGDMATFTDMDGNVFRYEVVTTDTLQPHQLQALLDDQYAMSLMTCTYDGTKRVTVRFQRK